MPAPSSAPQPGLVWYIQAAERVWGPYRQARLASFVIEKRLTADTLIAAHPNGPFGPAGGRWELQRLFEPFATPLEATPASASPPVPIKKEPRTAAGVMAEPGLTAATPDPLPPTFSRKPLRKATAAEAPRRALLVWGDLSSLNAQSFETTLAKYGTFAGVRPGVWLIRAEIEAATLRNALSRTLTGEDALLVVEAPLERVAWFNLDLEAESNLRQLWGGLDESPPDPRRVQT